MEGKRTTTKTDSELALNAVRDSVTAPSYVNTDSSLPANEDEVRIFSSSLFFCYFS